MHLSSIIPLMITLADMMCSPTMLLIPMALGLLGILSLQYQARRSREQAQQLTRRHRAAYYTTAFGIIFLLALICLVGAEPGSAINALSPILAFIGIVAILDGCLWKKPITRNVGLILAGWGFFSPPLWEQIENIISRI